MGGFGYDCGGGVDFGFDYKIENIIFDCGITLNVDDNNFFV